MAKLTVQIPINQYLDDHVATIKETNEMLIEVITTDNQFKKLEEEWNSLLVNSSSDSIFLTWEWISTWWKYFHHNTNLWIITARQAGTNQLVGIAPLAIKNTRNISGLNKQTLIFIGNGAVAPDHLDFIIRNGYENTVSKFFSEKLLQGQKNWSQIKIEGLVPTSPVLAQLFQQHPHLPKSIDETICPYLSLPDSWETLVQSLSKNMRYNLGRFKRRLHRDYPDVINIKKVCNQDEIKDFMTVLVDLHAASQQRKNNTGLFSDQKIIDFHTELAQVFLKNGWLRSYTLEVDDTSIAVLHCFQYNGTVSFYQSGFDQFWQRYSPGSQIMAHAIEEAIREKNKIFDFLRGDEDYKYKWTKSYSTELVLHIPLSFQNQLGLKFKKLSRKFLIDHF